MSLREGWFCPVALTIALVGTTAALAGEHSFHGYYWSRPEHVRVARPYGEDWHKTGPLRGATALCADGTSSFSEHPYAGGTCSYHGGRVSGVQRDGVPPGDARNASAASPAIRRPGEVPIISPYREVPMPDPVPCPNCAAPSK